MIRKSGVGIVDYGSGNIASLQSTLMKIGYRSKILSCPNDFEDIKVIIIPGVGAFPEAMEKLKVSGIFESILKAHNARKRIIGICLGMQLLAEEGFEIKQTKGLGLLKGKVQLHPDGLQVGWMKLHSNKGVDKYISGKEFYFNHSYYVDNIDENTLYTCKSSTIAHPAIVKKNEVVGIQFHPEKSQRFGLNLLGCAIRGEIT